MKTEFEKRILIRKDEYEKSRMTCIQYSIASAVANYLYLREKVEVDIEYAMAALLQIFYHADQPQPAGNPASYSGKICLQNTRLRMEDVSSSGNTIPKCTWKVPSYISAGHGI